MNAWRSVLSVPGHDARKVARAHDWGADHVFFDLEDSCPADRKAEARRMIAEAHRPGDGVRIADAADLELARSLDEPVIWIPKVEFPDTDVWPVCETGLPMVWLIESPRAVLRLVDLLATHRESLVALAFGSMDFCATAGVDQGSALALHARCQVALHAKAHGLQSIDSPCFTLTDGAMLSEVETAISCGFTGKGCISPRQVTFCDAFEASAYDAAAVVTAADRSADPVFRLGDQVVGPAAVRRAREALA